MSDAHQHTSGQNPSDTHSFSPSAASFLPDEATISALDARFDGPAGTQPGGTPIRCPASCPADAQLASLLSLLTVSHSPDERSARIDRVLRAVACAGGDQLTPASASALDRLAGETTHEHPALDAALDPDSRHVAALLGALQPASTPGLVDRTLAAVEASDQPIRFPASNTPNAHSAPNGPADSGGHTDTGNTQDDASARKPFVLTRLGGFAAAAAVAGALLLPGVLGPDIDPLDNGLSVGTADQTAGASGDIDIPWFRSPAETAADDAQRDAERAFEDLQRQPHFGLPDHRLRFGD